MRTTESTLPVEKLRVPISEHDHIQGPINAPVTLVEYGDYECPFCGQAHLFVKEIQRRLGKQLCFAFRNFPLTNMHPHSEHAAEAAEAAGAQGKFWEMHDALFENQRALEDEDLYRYAEELGLDANQLIEEVRAGAYAVRIRKDFRAGVRSGVNGTPTFFVNGERYDGAWGLEPLLAAVAGP